MKLLTKMAVTLFMAITLLSTIMLRSTSDLYLESQSAYANQPNVIWYILIHFGMMMSFFTLGAATKNKIAYTLAAFSSLLTLMLDMYGFLSLHNTATALLFGLSSYCLSFYSSSALRKAYLYVCLALGAVFAVEVVFRDFMPIDIYEIETVIEWCFAAMLLIDIYFFKKTS